MGCPPEYLTEQIRYFEEVQSYNFRNGLDYRPSRADTNAMQISLFSKGLNLYMIPAYMKNEVNMNIFRKRTVNFTKHVYFDQGLPNC